MSGIAAVAGGFANALKRHGVDAGTRRALTFAAVLDTLPPASARDLYWRARVAMLPSIDDAMAFDAAFASFFGALPSRDALGDLAERVDVPRRDDAPKRASLPPPPSERPADEHSAEHAAVQLIAAASDERLRDRSFDELDAAERAAMLQLMSRLRTASEVRRTRRRRAHRAGDRFDFRRTLRGAPRTAGELIHRRTSRRRERARPLVFLIDVSGSMEPFARALVQYARVHARARPNVRAFAFATALTDLTPLLKYAGDAEMMTALGTAVRDYGGGTRIGAALEAFNARYAQRGAARGGTVVIVSDGWEREDPAAVGGALERLRRLARRVVWVNPHKRHPAYEPLARGMAAALPYLDAFVSGHSLRTLDAVADAIEGRLP